MSPDTRIDLRCLNRSPVGCMILALKGGIGSGLEAGVGRVDLAGAAHLELVSGVVQLRPEDAMLEAMLRGWRAQQTARGLREDTIAPRERLVRRFLGVHQRVPVAAGGPAHVDEWTLSLIGEKHLAPSTIRGYQTRSAVVQRVPVRRPLRLGCGVREASSGRGCIRCRSATSGTRSPT